MEGIREALGYIILLGCIYVGFVILIHVTEKKEEEEKKKMN